MKDAKILYSVIATMLIMLPPQVNADSATSNSLQADYGHIPLSFEANHGQADERVKFSSRGPGFDLFLTPTEAALALRGPSTATGTEPEPRVRPNIVRMRFIDSNPHTKIVGTSQLPGEVNYFRGDKPADWHTNIPTYAAVRYEDIYPGIDLVFYDGRQQLEFDFVVAPGADPNNIQFTYTGIEAIELDDQGDIRLVLPDGELKQRAPVIYQDVEGIRKTIRGAYVFKEPDVLSFEVSNYDAARALVVDPILEYSTYFGGSGQDISRDIAVDNLGNIYIFGDTDSYDFPTFDPIQPNRTAYGDVFVTKLDPSGAHILFSTYLGGNGVESSWGGGPAIAVDADHNVYLTGATNSADFPTTPGVWQPEFAGDPTKHVGQRRRDLFVAKLNTTGDRLLYSTYLGGSDDDIGGGIAVDALGNAYIAGTTKSDDFPTSNPFQSSLRATVNGVIVKLDATASSLIYSTYLGGSGGEITYSIAIDEAGSAYVGGKTSSSDFPTLNSFQSSLAGSSDAFVTKLSPSGTSLVYSTYLGGSSKDESVAGMFVDDLGSAYVTGSTRSDDFPTINALQPKRGGRVDAFISKIHPDGTSLQYSTYLGGSRNETIYGLSAPVVDRMGNAYLTGETQSTNFPTVNAFQTSLGGISDFGPGDAFVAKLNAQGNGLLYSTYFGGEDGDMGLGIALDKANSAYVVGRTNSDDFPLANPLQASQRNGDGFVAKISPVVTAIDIDIKLGNKRNAINPRKKGVIWVAMLSDTGNASPFDPSSQVDIGTVRFGPDEATATRFKVKDVNKDGLGDLLLRFKVPETGIACGDTELTLNGETFDGQSIIGTDTVNTVGCNKARKATNRKNKRK
jgi:hypothetical protein